MAGFDGTLGSQRVGTLPGSMRIEMGVIDNSGDVSADVNAVPTTLTTLLGGVAGVDASVGCASGAAKAASIVSLCSEGPVLCFTVADVTTGTGSARLQYVAWGF